MPHTGDHNLVCKRDLVCGVGWGGGQVYLFFEIKSEGHKDFTEQWLHTANTGYLGAAYDI